jgi:hypothetical protein
LLSENDGTGCEGRAMWLGFVGHVARVVDQMFVCA